MRTVESFVAELSDTDLARAVREIQAWKNTTVLKEGVTSKLASCLMQEYGVTCPYYKMAEDALLERAAEKYAELLGL
jgi:hypothetical protein